MLFIIQHYIWLMHLGMCVHSTFTFWYFSLGVGRTSNSLNKHMKTAAVWWHIQFRSSSTATLRKLSVSVCHPHPPIPGLLYAPRNASPPQPNGDSRTTSEWLHCFAGCVFCCWGNGGDYDDSRSLRCRCSCQIIAYKQTNIQKRCISKAAGAYHMAENQLRGNTSGLVHIL